MDYNERLRQERLYKYDGELSEEIKKYALELIRTCSTIGLDNGSFIHKRIMPMYCLDFESGRWKLCISLDTYQLTKGDFKLIVIFRRRRNNYLVLSHACNPFRMSENTSFAGRPLPAK